MKRYNFLGRVLPSFPKRVSYPVVPSANPEKKGSLGFEIQKSIITAELTAEHLENPTTALKSVEQTIQGLVDAFSFISGERYDVRLEAVKEDNNEYLFKESSLTDLLPDLQSQEIPQVEVFMGAAVEHMSLRFALSNFKKAKHYTAYTGFYIYLAIENIKKFFYPADLKNESEEWEGLRSKLSLSREDIDFAKKYADHVRHGRYQDVAGADNTKILRLGAEIIIRFYRHLSTQT